MIRNIFVSLLFAIVALSGLTSADAGTPPSSCSDAQAQWELVDSYNHPNGGTLEIHMSWNRYIKLEWSMPNQPSVGAGEQAFVGVAYTIQIPEQGDPLNWIVVQEGGVFGIRNGCVISDSYWPDQDLRINFEGGFLHEDVHFGNFWCVKPHDFNMVVTGRTGNMVIDVGMNFYNQYSGGRSFWSTTYCYHENAQSQVTYTMDIEKNQWDVYIPMWETDPEDPDPTEPPEDPCDSDPTDPDCIVQVTT